MASHLGDAISACVDVDVSDAPGEFFAFPAGYLVIGDAPVRLRDNNSLKPRIRPMI